MTNKLRAGIAAIAIGAAILPASAEITTLGWIPWWSTGWTTEIAIDPAREMAIVPGSFSEGPVVIRLVDLASYTVAADIATSDRAASVYMSAAVDPRAGRVYVTTWDWEYPSGHLWVVDLDGRRLAASLPFDGLPSAVRVNPLQRRVYVQVWRCDQEPCESDLLVLDADSLQLRSRHANIGKLLELDVLRNRIIGIGASGGCVEIRDGADPDRVLGAAAAPERPVFFSAFDPLESILFVADWQNPRSGPPGEPVARAECAGSRVEVRELGGVWGMAVNPLTQRVHSVRWGSGGGYLTDIASAPYDAPFLGAVRGGAGGWFQPVAVDPIRNRTVIAGEAGLLVYTDRLPAPKLPETSPVSDTTHQVSLRWNDLKESPQRLASLETPELLNPTIGALGALTTEACETFWDCYHPGIMSCISGRCGLAPFNCHHDPCNGDAMKGPCPEGWVPAHADTEYSGCHFFCVPAQYCMQIPESTASDGD